MRNFNDFFDELDPGEIDALLEGIDSPGLDKKAESRILRRALRSVPFPGRSNKRRVRLIAAMAACAAVVCLAGLGGRAYALELEYNEAVEFFGVHDLTTQGLTKAEIRQVYRDITTNSFTCSKTAEVLDRSAVLNSVPGFDIVGREPTPEELRAYWESLSAGLSGWDAVTHGVTYKVDWSARDDDGSTRFESNRLEKYEDGELVWRSSPITAFHIEGFKEVSDGVIVYGVDYDEETFRDVETWLTKLDENGMAQWTLPLLNDFTDEDVKEVLELEDGTLAVFSAGWERMDGAYKGYVCLTRLTPDGEITYIHSVAPEGGALAAAARLGNGYLALLGERTLLRLDADGNALGYLSYDVEGGVTVITDLLEYNGTVYLSGYSAPAAEDGYGQDEIGSVLRYIFDNDLIDITSEELTPMVRECYTALLLICEPDTGRVRSFYSSEGCLGGKLEYGDGGELLWDVESISGTFFSPATNSFTIGGNCDVYRCSFSPEGELLSREATGESVLFRK